MSTQPEPDCGSSSCIFSAKGGMRTNGPCRCYENAGFHGSAVMAAKQMLREVLLLRAKLDATSKWIILAERLPAKNETVLAMVDSDSDPAPMLLVYMPSHNEDPMPWRLYGTYGWFNSVSVLKWAPIPSEEA